MIERLEEVFSSLDKKNKIMLYLSVLIVVFIVYYHFNLGYLSKKEKKLKDTLNSYKSELKYVSGDYDKKLIKLKEEYKKLKLKFTNLKVDLMNVKFFIKTTKILMVDNKEIVSVLKLILNSAYKNKIISSYFIDSKEDKNYSTLLINIEGGFNPYEVNKFYNFLTTLESLKKVDKIESFSLRNNFDDVNFSIRFKIWGIK
jgi:hypothetical protein